MRVSIPQTLDNFYETQTNTKTISEQIRDVNLKQMDPNTLGFTENLVYIAINENNGICDKHIQKYIYDKYKVFLPISSINGRRNNLIKKGLVIPVGSDYIPDHNGHTRLNTLWGCIKI